MNIKAQFVGKTCPFLLKHFKIDTAKETVAAELLKKLAPRHSFLMEEQQKNPEASPQLKCQS